MGRRCGMSLVEGRVQGRQDVREHEHKHEHERLWGMWYMGVRVDYSVSYNGIHMVVFAWVQYSNTQCGRS